MRALLVILALLALVIPASAGTVNRAAKQDMQGNSRNRICALTEADNIEIVNRLSPHARIVRFKDEQAKLYLYLLKTGENIEGTSRRIHGGYDNEFPNAQTIYIVSRPGRTSVYPFFVVDGCVARFVFQIPRKLHAAILMQMRNKPA